MITLGGIQLPNLLIDDELSWTGIKSTVATTLGGGLVIWERHTSGKPITLKGGADYAWIKRSVLLQLKLLASVPSSVYTLDYNGDIKQVRFMNEESPVIEAEPLVGSATPTNEDFYNNVTIKLMEVY